MAVAILRRVEGKRRITTVELKANDLEPVTEGHIFARSRLLRVGSTLAVGQRRAYRFDDTQSARPLSLSCLSMPEGAGTDVAQRL